MNIDNRRIVQIIQTKNGGTLALCNDGTVWRLSRNSNHGYAPSAYSWERMPGVPQHEY
jgi:hypothetical protein